MTTKRFLTLLLIAIAFGFIAFRGIVRDTYIEWTKPAVPSEIPVSEATRTPTPTGVGAVAGPINLAVQFFTQAPAGDWSEPWQNACEESSAILVGAYWSNETLTADSMAQHILQAVAWENEHFGYYQETTAAQTAEMIRALYGYERVDVLYDVGIADILKNVRAGRPVIVPLAGQMLGNPYYKPPGPVYHMLVVKGVADNGDIITNDVGTRHGKNLTYSPSVFLNAMHDAPQGGATWPADVDPVQYIKTGRRAIIVVYPN
jgi:hypothetical protein